MNYQNLPGGDTIGSADELPAMLEDEEGLPLSALSVYDDKAPPNPKTGSPGHNPTIGFGVNLRSSAGSGGLALVLNQIQINGTNVFTQAVTQGQTPATVVLAFQTIINQYPSSTYPTAAALEAALSAKLGAYFGIPAVQSASERLFQLTQGQAQTIVDQLVDGYSIPGYSAPSLYTQMQTALEAKGVPSGDVPPPTSEEALALGSLFYNAKTLLGPQLISGLEDNNRAQVWYQIRYGSNANALTAKTSGSIGLAKRRYYESQVFGLSATDDTWQQADQNYEMLMEHRASILKYETMYGEPPAGSPSSTDEVARANSDYYGADFPPPPGSPTVQNLVQSFDPDAAVITGNIDSWYSSIVSVGVQGFGTPGSVNFLATNILIAPDATDIADGFASPFGTSDDLLAIDAPNANQILIGPDSVTDPGSLIAQAALTGGAGNDLLVAGAGNEILYGGIGGSDTLIGGQGLPSSIAGAAGNDTLYAGAGIDTFDFALPATSPVSETIVAGAQTKGTIEVSNNGSPTVLGGSASSQLTLAGAAGTVAWSGSGYLYTLTGDTMTITNTQPVGSGGMGGSSIIIDNFNLSAAESATGYLGIYLSDSALVVQNANDGQDPPLANFQEGSSDSFTYGVSAPSASAQTVTVTLSGADPSDFDVATATGIENINSNGTFNLTLPAGETNATFALIDVTPDNGQSDISGGTNIQLTTSMPSLDSSAPAVQAPAVNFNYVPTSWNTDGEAVPNDTVTLNGGIFTGSGGNYNVSMTGSGNDVQILDSGDDSVMGTGGDNNQIFAGDGNDIISAGGGGQNIIQVGKGDSEIYAGTRTTLSAAIVNAATAEATGAQGDDISALDGDNSIVGGTGNDTITVGTGDDIVVLGPGSDQVFAGIESTQLGGVPDTVYGSGLGTSVYSTDSYLVDPYNNSFAQPYNGQYGEYEQNNQYITVPYAESNATIVGGTGNDIILLGNGDNYVDVGTGNSSVYGGMGDDVIIGGSGTEFIKGGGGSTYIAGGSGTATIYGGDGDNTIIGGSGNETITSSNYYNRTSGLDTTQFSGANLNQNYITGGSGNDVIYGSAGTDTIYAGSGNTTVYGGTGTENLYGGAGNDAILGGSGSDTITAGSGHDTLQGSSSSNAITVIYGGTGTEEILGGDGTDSLYAGDGGTADAATSVYAYESDSAALTTIYGGSGVQLLEGGSGSTVIYAGDGGTGSAPVSVFGYGSGDNTIYGGEGTDLIQGGSGSNILYAGDGGTTSALTSVDGGSGTSTIYGGAGVDILQDTVAGDDLLVAGDGDATLNGIGNDTMEAGSGVDVFDVEGGSVTVDLSTNSGDDSVYALNGSTVNLNFGTGVELSDVTASVGADTAGNWYLDLQDDGAAVAVAGGLTGALQEVTYADTGGVSVGTLLTDAFGADQVFTSSTNNTLALQLGNSESVAGGANNSAVSSWGASDTILGAGNTDIYSAGTSATISSDGGNTIDAAGSGASISSSYLDKVTVSGANSLVTTGVGYESITASGSNDTLEGGAAYVTYYVNNSSTVIQAPSGEGGDTIVASVTYTAPSNVNVLTLTGTANISATGNSGSDTLTGGAGTDTLVAGAGLATLIGGSGNTTFVINATGDAIGDGYSAAHNAVQSSVSYSLPTDVNTLVLTGTAGLIGTTNGGTDTLASNSGVDTLIGGSGHDTFVINNPADVIEPGTGTTTILYAGVANYTLPGTLNSLTLTGSGSLSVTANSSNDTLTANAGADTFVGGAGNDTFIVSSSIDVVLDTLTTTTNVLQSTVPYTLPANVNTLTLLGSAAVIGTGNSGADSLIANAGADTLVSGAGADTLIGGGGNDTFVVTSTADKVSDTYSATTNTIESAVGYSLVTNVNNLILTGTGALVGTANSAADTLTANSGADTLVGGSAADTFILDSTADVVEDTSSSASNVIDSSVSYVLPTDVNTLVLTGTANVQGTSNGANDSLVGGSGADSLIATSGQDTLVAGGGATTLTGGTGNDLFVVNSTSDVVTVGGSHGADSIESSANYTLPSGVSDLILIGSAALVATAVSGNNALLGNAGNDTLQAGSGNDTLTAGVGTATLVGGSGIDTFVINSAADLIASISGASGNTVMSSVSYTMQTGITNLTLTGTANIAGTGNATNGTLTAGLGTDTLFAGAGDETLVGGAIGADLFVINSSSDSVIDPNGSKPGVDTIDSSVSYTLPSTVNDLLLTGTTALLAGGNGNSDAIVGNAGADTLMAGTGDDTLVAGAGLATLIGGAGNETFIINSTSDVVEDTSSTAVNVLESSASYSLPTDINSLELTGTMALVATANGGPDSILGNAGSDTLIAGAGQDTLHGGSGTNTFIAGTGGDTFIVTSAADIIQGVTAGDTYAVLALSSFSLPTNVNVLTLEGDANSTAQGNSGADLLTAGAGTDTLIAGSGIDTLVGGSGNTTFVVNSTGDVVQDSSTTTTNTVTSSVNYTLPTNISVLVFTGTTNLAAVGNSGTDTLIANSGQDTFTAGAGNDTFIIGNGSDVIVDTSMTSNDIVESSLSYSLPTNVNTLQLTGTGSVSGTANSGTDVLITNSGADTLVGGTGNDTFILSGSADIVLDSSATASNTLESGGSYSLPTDVNTLILTGSSSIVGTGNSGTDLLTENSGSSTLVAGTGIATLVGGAGNDTFVVDNSGDEVLDTFTSTSNTLDSSVSYTLPTNVGNLVLTGTGNLTGTLNAGNETLVSNSGVDTLVGGAGPELFIVNNSSDVLQNLTASDTVESSVSYTAPSGAVDLVLTDGVSGALEATGGSGNDTLTAGAGTDTLVAGAGVTTMMGGSGNDTFVLNNTSDVVADTNYLGSNTIESAVNYTLPQYVDTLTLTGTAALTATGNGDISNVLNANSGIDELVGEAFNTTINGGSGIDQIVAGPGTNVLYAGSGGTVSGPTYVFGNSNLATAGTQTTIYGGSGAAILLGGPGSDVIMAGTGADSLYAGTGYDSLYGSANGDLLIDTASSGTDLLVAGSGSETLEGINGDTLVAGSGSDVLSYVSGADAAGVYEINPGFGNVTIGSGQGSVNNLVFGSGLSPSSFTASLVQTGHTGFLNNDMSLVFTDGSETITIPAGLAASVIGSITFAGSGPETLTQWIQASSGQGTFDIDYNGDPSVVFSTNNSQALQDTVYDSVLYAFGNNDTVTTVGNAGAQVLAYGNNEVISAQTTWAGGSGDAITELSGGDVETLAGGNDSITLVNGSEALVYQSSDVVEAPPGASGDAVAAFVSYSLPSGIQSLFLRGTGLTGYSNSVGGQLIADGNADTVVGGSGADTLQGLLSNDVLVGGSGVETYIVDSSTYPIVLGSGPADLNTVVALDNYTLPTGVNNLDVDADSVSGYGNGSNDVLLAEGASDLIVAGAGQDTLTARGATLDTLVGGAGNDTFEISNPFDTVVDSFTTATNTLISYASFTLPTNINTLILAGSGVLGAGNTASDSLVAEGNADTILGGSGADTLTIANTVYGAVAVAGSGSDVLQDGSSGGNTFVLNSGFSNDLIVPAGNDTLQFGAGITASSLTFRAVLGSAGSAPLLVITGAGERATIQGGVVPGSINEVEFSGGTTETVGQLLVPSADQTITGSSGNLILSNVDDDSIVGGSGSDSVIAWGNADTLNAGTGGTAIYAAGTDDIVTGGSGTDSLVADGNSDTLNGGAGNENLVVNNATAVVNVTAGTGQDTVYSSVSYTVPQNVTIVDLIGSSLIDITANSGNDLITGNAGADVFLDGGGADTFLAGTGKDTFYVHDTLDTIQVSSSTTSDAVVASISYSLPTNVNSLILTGSANLTATGNSGNDYIEGNYGSDVLTAGSGNDTLQAYYNESAVLGYDTLIGGSGNDSLFVGYIYGDSIVSGSGVDTLVPGDWNVVVINNSADVLNLTYGAIAPSDTIQSSVSYTLAEGVANNDTAEGADADITWKLTGTGGITADAGLNDAFVTITGNAGADTIIGGTGINDLIAGTGVATLVGVAGSSNNFTVTNSADVIVDNSGSADVLYADASYTLPAAIDTLYVESANLVGTGNSGNDYIEADGGNDTLVAGSGTDTLRTTTGVNTLIGGTGADLFDIRAGDMIELVSGFGPSQISVTGGSGTPTVRFGAGVTGSSLTVSAILDSSGAAALAIVNGANAVTLDGALAGENYQFNFNGTGTLTLAQFLSEVNVTTSSVAGASGIVLLEGMASTSAVGGSGNDTIYAAGTADTITGGSGAQVLDALGANDSIVGGSASDTLAGLGTNDTLVAGIAIDTLIGGTGASVAFVINSTSDVLQLQTSPGSDTVLASVNFSLPANINTLVLADTPDLEGTANSGADTLTSGAGLDTLMGGSGSDTFIVNDSTDVVQDTSTSATNILQASVSYSLPTNVNTLILTGTEAVTGTANGGSDTLTANSGADTLVGGAGSDTFILDNSADIVQDTFTSTHNTIEAGFNYSLPTNVNALVLTGTAALTGTANTGSDTLTANTGADTLFGGSGSDTFVVSSTSDVIQDTSTTAANTIQSSVSYTLPTNVNAITLTGSANLVATANASNDTLTANAGVDTLVGGTGNDAFVVSNAGDVVVDTSATATNQVSSSVSYTLPADVNALVLTGTGALQGTGNSGNDTLTANSGADTLVGGSGNDTFTISNSASVVTDTFTSTSNMLRSSVGYTLPTNVNTLTLTGTAALKATANSGNDSMTANTGADTLVAGSGNDTLVSGTSRADSLVGGAGNDAFFVNSTSDVVTDTFTTTVNTMVSSVSYTLPTNVNSLQFTGTAALRGVANGGNDSLVANTGADTLVAGAGVDTLVSGTAGADSLVGGTGNDVFFVNNTAVHVSDASGTAINVIDSIVTFSLPTDVNTLILLGNSALTGKGNAGADSIIANGGNDTLTAGTGVATLTGGAGADRFVIDNTGDVVVDTFAGTSNTLSSTVTYSLPTNVNALIFTGTAALKGTANSGNDTLTANTGADTLVGGSGNDTFVIDKTTNVVSDTFTSTSNTLSSSVTYSLPTNVNTLIFTGTAALKGTANSGNDTLTANSGADTLVGGSGNDTFVISSTTAKVTDTFATTSNTLSSSVAYTLPTNINTLILTGTTALKGTANSGNDSLIANSGSDTLAAGSGVDTLISGASGTDSLVGGSSNDTFVVNNTADIVTDTFGTTTNSLQASVSYTLPTNVNVMVLTGTAALVGTGNAHTDTITANSGADTLTAGSGVATLIGGTGNDTFVVNNTADVVTVTTSGTSGSVLSSVNYVLPANLEYLTLTGTAALTATGNSLTDLIIGNTGNDTLTGGSGIAVLEGGRTAGSDVLDAISGQAALIAGAGSSTLTGGAFKDFYAAGGVSDTITTGATANVIAVNSGDGATTLQPTTGSSDILSLGAGIDTEALEFTKSGSNLILTDGVGGDSITLTNWYAGSSDQDVATLQVVEAASASYNSGGSDGLRNQPLEDFNFAALVSAFNTAGSPASWSLSNDMASAQIASSATHAYGGDLAYYFGLNGNLTGLELSAAQSTLTNGVFATGQQTIDSWSSISGGGGLQLLVAKAPVSQATVAAAPDAAMESQSPVAAPLTNAVQSTAEPGAGLPMKRSADLGLHRGQAQLQALMGASNFVTPTALSWAAVAHSAANGVAGGALAQFEHEEEGLALLYAGTSAFKQRPLIERGPLDNRRSA